MKPFEITYNIYEQICGCRAALHLYCLVLLWYLNSVLWRTEYILNRMFQGRNLQLCFILYAFVTEVFIKTANVSILSLMKCSAINSFVPNDAIWHIIWLRLNVECVKKYSALSPEGRHMALSFFAAKPLTTPYGANSGGISIGYLYTNFDVIMTNIYFSQ